MPLPLLSRTSVLLAASALLLAFYVFAFPAMSALLDGNTPTGGEFDTVFFYTPAQALHKASLFNAAQVRESIMGHWTFDLAYPLAYGLFFASAWAFGLRLLGGLPRKEQVTQSASVTRWPSVALPMAAVVFDLCENASVSVLLYSYAAAGPAGLAARIAAATASAFTLLKWLAVVPALAGAVLLPAVGLVALATRKR